MKAADTFTIGTLRPGGGTTPPIAAMGAKAHHLARMADLGLPVPPAFVLGTRHCADSLGASGLRPNIRNALPPLLATVEEQTQRSFGDARRPLLVAVRSGAPVSMPGMMQTLLNIGLSDRTLAGFLRLTGNPRLVWDAYRRLVAQFGEVVAGVPAEAFEYTQSATALGPGEPALDFAALRALTQRHLDTYRQATGTAFPQDPQEQLERAITAVFASWQAPHARSYRQTHGIPDEPGTAVIVQAMVFGNAGGRSGAGVGFTRDPTTGEPGLWVDYLPNAQGEDVVSGRRIAHGAQRLALMMPEVWSELTATADKLERAFADMQDFEFTVEEGRLFMLQTREGKRSALAALRILLDLHDEKIIDAGAACARAAAIESARLTVPRVIAADGGTLIPLAQAASANTGVAIGEIVLDEAAARARVDAGAAVVLVRRDAETTDLAALDVAQGLLTQRGARTSHAAVVARQLGKVCLVGCARLVVDVTGRTVRIGERVLAEGDVITLDGNSGQVFAGAALTVSERPDELLARLAALPGWTQDRRASPVAESAIAASATPS
jgi:pyruvate,orthophosphate dikinase